VEGRNKDVFRRSWPSAFPRLPPSTSQKLEAPSLIGRVCIQMDVPPGQLKRWQVQPTCTEKPSTDRSLGPTTPHIPLRCSQLSTDYIAKKHAHARPMLDEGCDHALRRAQSMSQTGEETGRRVRTITRGLFGHHIVFHIGVLQHCHRAPSFHGVKVEAAGEIRDGKRSPPNSLPTAP